MMASIEGLYGGLSSLADQLKVDRIGPMHQAGSDSLLTAQTFFSLIESHMGGACDDSRYTFDTVLCFMSHWTSISIY